MLPHAKTRIRRNSDTVPRRPTPMPSTHKKWFCSSTFLGVTEQRRRRGLNGLALRPPVGAQIHQLYLLPPIDYSSFFSTLGQHPTSLATCASVLNEYKYTYLRHRPTARIGNGRNIQNLQQVATVRLPSNLGTTTNQVYIHIIRILKRISLDCCITYRIMRRSGLADMCRE